MTEITTNSILAEISKSSAAQTSAPALPEPLSNPQGQAELRTSNRSRTRSKRAQEGGYDKKLATDKQRASRAARTRARNKEGRSSSHAQSSTESIQHTPSAVASEDENGGRNYSRSPTPIATTDEPEAQSTRVEIQERIARKLQRTFKYTGTQTLRAVEEALSTDPAYATQSQEQSAEARFLPPVMVGIGAGFHLDHPTHRPGNSKTYRRTKGGQHPSSASRSSDCIQSNQLNQTGSTEPETELEPNIDDRQYCIVPYLAPQEQAASPPPLPVNDTNSPFLAYPDDPGSPRSISQSLGHGSPTSSPNRNGLPGLSPPHLRDSITHVSETTSSKSLADRPISTPSPLAGHDQTVCTLQQTHLVSNSGHSASQNSRLKSSQQRHGSTPEPSALNLTPSEPDRRAKYSTPAQPHAKRPLQMPATPLPSRKRPAITVRSTPGGSTYRGRLNIVEINSERVMPKDTASRQGSRRSIASRQTRKKSKGSTTGGVNRALPTSDQTGNDDIDLLDGFNVDQFVVNSAKQGKLVDTGYHKSTTHDLPGWQRSIWKDTLEMTWAFSMGQGNFQTRSVYSSWGNACARKLIQQRFPDMDITAMTVSGDMMTVILNNLSNERHRDVLRLRNAVQDYYQLKNPSTPNECQDIKGRTHAICPSGFHCKDMENGVDPYEGEILPLSLKAVFFYGPDAIGARYFALFQRSDDLKDERKHLAVLAYLATMVQFCLQEWSEGYFEKGKLNATKQHSVWICHFDGLKNVSIIARQRLIDTYKQWVEDAYDASQAQPTFGSKDYVQPIVLPEDVRPDTPSRLSSPSDYE